MACFESCMIIPNQHKYIMSSTHEEYSHITQSLEEVGLVKSPGFLYK